MSLLKLTHRETLRLATFFLLKKLLRKYAYPTLYDLYIASKLASVSANEVIKFLFDNNFGGILENCFDEGKTVFEELNSIVNKLGINSINKLSLLTLDEVLLLWCIINVVRPKIIVETGVGYGSSTFVFLKGLSKIGKGNLLSFDINSESGIIPRLILDKLPSSVEWNFIIIKPKFKDLLRSLPSNIDIFFHDSEHSYYWQYNEYLHAYERLVKGGYLISDDVDSSLAFIDFNKKINKKPILLITERKVLGLVEK